VTKRPRLVVMVKEPRAGQVKTRLGRDLGLIPATWWFRHQLSALLRRLEDPRWELVLAVAPDYRGLTSRQFPAHRPACVIGADIPGIRKRHIAQAFKALHRADVVFGPAPDGGFWLVGHSARCALPPRIFEGARWSTEHALADSVASLPHRGAIYLETLRDVDTAADLPPI